MEIKFNNKLSIITYCNKFSIRGLYGKLIAVRSSLPLIRICILEFMFLVIPSIFYKIHIAHWVSWRLESLVNRLFNNLFMLTTNKVSKVCIISLRGESVALRWFFHKKGTEMWKAFSCLKKNMACLLWAKSLWPTDAIWWQRSGSTSVEVMAYCKPSYWNQCWLVISEVQWHPSGNNFTRDNWAINH